MNRVFNARSLTALLLLVLLVGASPAALAGEAPMTDVSMDAELSQIAPELSGAMYMAPQAAQAACPVSPLGDNTDPGDCTHCPTPIPECAAGEIEVLLEFEGEQCTDPDIYNCLKTATIDAPAGEVFTGGSYTLQVAGGENLKVEIDGSQRAQGDIANPMDCSWKWWETGQDSTADLTGFVDGKESFQFQVTMGGPVMESACGTGMFALRGAIHACLDLQSEAEATVEANDDSAETGMNEPVAIDVAANDDGGNYPLDLDSITIVTAPDHGTTEIGVGDGVITYTPDLDYYGPDSFVYQIENTEGQSDTATVHITVAGPPVISSIDPESVVLRAQSFELTVSGSDFDADAVILWEAGTFWEQALDTTFVDSNTLTATVDASLLEAVDTHIPIKVLNPEFGLVSDPANFRVTAPQVWIDPASAEMAEGDTVTVTVMATANDLYGAQFALSFNNAMVNVVDEQITLGSMWSGLEHDWIVDTVDNNAGEIEFAATLRSPEDALYVEDAELVTIEFEYVGSGTSALDLSDVILSNRDGLSLEPVEVSDGYLYAQGVVCAQGVVQLQGRPGAWNGVTVTIDGGPGGPYTDVTATDGTWEICGIVEGTYDVTVEMPRYLGSERLNQHLTAGATHDLGTVRLLGGDITDGDGGDGDGVIDISDATLLGSDFNIGDDPRTDINDDGVTNILDAAILGGNWQQTFPVTW